MKSKNPILKWCDRCNKTYGLKFFSPDKNKKYGRADVCKACMAFERKNNKIENTKIVVKRDKIEMEALISIYEEQKGKCAICEKSFPKTMISKNGGLFVDHCHKTGKVRGLLCRKCNAGIGMLHDNITYLQNAIEYLNKNQYGRS